MFQTKLFSAQATSYSMTPVLLSLWTTFSRGKGMSFEQLKNSTECTMGSVTCKTFFLLPAVFKICINLKDNFKLSYIQVRNSLCGKAKYAYLMFGAANRSLRPEMSMSCL